jgi:hypothetical protein
VKRSRGLQVSDARSVLLLLSHYVPSHLASAVTRVGPPLERLFTQFTPLPHLYSSVRTLPNLTRTTTQLTANITLTHTPFLGRQVIPKALIRTPAHIRAHIITSLITTYALQPQSTYRPFLSTYRPFLSTYRPFLSNNLYRPSLSNNLYRPFLSTYHLFEHTYDSPQSYACHHVLAHISPFLEHISHL